jgi:hypothetical protein
LAALCFARLCAALRCAALLANRLPRQVDTTTPDSVRNTRQLDGNAMHAFCAQHRQQPVSLNVVVLEKQGTFIDSKQEDQEATKWTTARYQRSRKEADGRSEEE